MLGTHLLANCGEPEVILCSSDQVFFTTTSHHLWTAPLTVFGSASVERVGAGCAGSNGVPSLDYVNAPLLGSNAFALRLTSALPNAFVCSVIGTDRVRIPVSTGCIQEVGGTTATTTTISDAVGAASLPLAIPANAALVGVSLTAQTAVFDPAGAAVPGVAASNGVVLQVGR